MQHEREKNEKAATACGTYRGDRIPIADELALAWVNEEWMFRLNKPACKLVHVFAGVQLHVFVHLKLRHGGRLHVWRGWACLAFAPPRVQPRSIDDWAFGR